MRGKQPDYQPFMPWKSCPTPDLSKSWERVVCRITLVALCCSRRKAIGCLWALALAKAILHVARGAHFQPMNREQSLNGGDCPIVVGP